MANLNLIIKRKLFTNSVSFFPKKINVSPLVKNYDYIKNEKIQPWFITGLTDAEGVFSLKLIKDSRNKSKPPKDRFRVSFAIAMKYENELLVQIFHYFNCGNLSVNKDNMTVYNIQDINSLYHKILPHFDKYPLQGTKQMDYLNFKNAVTLMYNKTHLTTEGFKDIMTNFLQMNTKRVKNVITLKEWRNLELTPLPLNGNYINGFIAGDGSIVVLTNITNLKVFGKIILSFTQHIDNYILIYSILRYFHPKVKPTNHGLYSIGGMISGTKNWDLYLSNHFKEYPMYGHKKLAIIKLFEIRSLLEYKSDVNVQNKIIHIWNDFNKRFNSPIDYK